MEEYRYSGEDIIYSVVITDQNEDAINYEDAVECKFEFTNAIQNLKKVKPTSILEGDPVNNGDDPDTFNRYVCEIRDFETDKLSKGTVNVKITLVLADADFIDGEATVIAYDSFILK